MKRAMTSKAASKGSFLLLAALLLLAVASSLACAEAKALDVLPDAFGEALDGLDEATIRWCVGRADRALAQLLEDFARDVGDRPQGGYLQMLQTTLLLPGQKPAEMTGAEEEIWRELFGDGGCVVSFVTLDDGLHLGAVPYAEYTGRYGDYAVGKNGSVASLSLRAIHTRYFKDPVLPGVRVINMGSFYSGIYTIPGNGEESSTSLLEFLNDPALFTFAERFEEDFPVSVSVCHDGEASGVPVTSTDPQTIHGVFEALCQITVLGEWPLSSQEDDYLQYSFAMANGSVIHGFQFQDGMLLHGWKASLYQIAGFDALQEVLADPGLW